jgi:hypothetical protein
MLRQKKVNAYKGKGYLEADNEKIEVRYLLNEYEDQLEEGVPGLRAIRGFIFPNSETDIPMLGRAYLLHLDDNRKSTCSSSLPTGKFAQPAASYRSAP